MKNAQPEELQKSHLEWCTSAGWMRTVAKTTERNLRETLSFYHHLFPESAEWANMSCPTFRERYRRQNQQCQWVGFVHRWQMWLYVWLLTCLREDFSEVPDGHWFSQADCQVYRPRRWWQIKKKNTESMKQH